MKKIVFYLICVAATLALFSCKNKSTEGEHLASSGQFKDTSIFYPADSAKRDIALYDTLRSIMLRDTSVMSKMGADTSIFAPVAYTTRSMDLLKALGLPDSLYKYCQHKNARIYFGIRADSVRLYFVPVDNADLDKGEGGTDVFLDGNGSPNYTDMIHSYVLDLNAPCPKTCATNNILSGNQQ